MRRLRRIVWLRSRILAGIQAVETKGRAITTLSSARRDDGSQCEERFRRNHFVDQQVVSTDCFDPAYTAAEAEAESEAHSQKHILFVLSCSSAKPI
ncbi:hypothetical protein ACMD2_22740 [Ananas comosus]|uniref:Uncharacterized protein n=1 Tax=Ananas comosus TaxID=4615 RepID=A0A199V3Y2_ANACO|nr:hypothetical protein ACMD2_22740 [Ananas comosus]